MAPQLAWIGLGNMGKSMCLNLAKEGNLSTPLLVFNRTEKRATDLRDSVSACKITVSPTAEDAISKSDIIFICVSNDAAVEEIFADALKKGGRSIVGKLFVDCSTVHPNTTRSLAKKVREAGAELVASPLLGMPAMAAAGQLVCLLAGPASAIGRVKLYTEGILSRGSIVVSETDAGMASTLKIVANTFVLSMVEALAEGHTLAEKSGLGADMLEQVLDITFPGLYHVYSKTMSSGDYHKMEEPLVSIEMARKDTSHALQLAKEYGVEMKAVKVAAEHLQAAEKHVGPQKEAAGIYGAVRQESGLKYEN